MATRGSDVFEQTIRSMLDKRAAEDELFAKAYAKDTKSIEECCSFIIGEVQKMGISAMTDEEVLSLAIHYYDEDDARVKPHGRCTVVAPELPEVAEARKEELRKEAEQAYYEEALATMRKVKKMKPTLSEEKASEQLLF